MTVNLILTMYTDSGFLGQISKELKAILEVRKITPYVFKLSIVITRKRVGICYKGEVDEKGQRCGYGVAIYKRDGRKISGTWLDGVPHGIGK